MLLNPTFALAANAPNPPPLAGGAAPPNPVVVVAASDPNPPLLEATWPNAGVVAPCARLPKPPPAGVPALANAGGPEGVAKAFEAPSAEACPNAGAPTLGAALNGPGVCCKPNAPVEDAPKAEGVTLLKAVPAPRPDGCPNAGVCEVDERRAQVSAKRVE